MAGAKGTVLIGAVKYLRTHIEDARKILPDDLQHYLSERVSPAAWYPEEDMLGLIRAVVQLMPGDEGAALQTFGVVTARALGEGIYSHLISDGASNSGTFALWASMHDTGQLTVTSEDKQSAVYQLIDYGHPAPEMCSIVGAYIQETMRMGGRNAQISKVDCVLTGSKACTWRAVW